MYYLISVATLDYDYEALCGVSEPYLDQTQSVE